MVGNDLMGVEIWLQVTFHTPASPKILTLPWQEGAVVGIAGEDMVTSSP